MIKSEKMVGVELGEGEKVQVEVRRSRKGLVLIWAGEVVGFVLLSVVLVLASRGGENSFIPLNGAAMGYLYLLIGMLYVVLILSGAIGTAVYLANSLTVTNRRGIQRSTTSLFARSTNVIDLQSVEDVSFAKKNVFDQIMGVGTVRMATVGDETTYTLNYVDDRGGEVRKIMKIVAEAKAKK